MTRRFLALLLVGLGLSLVSCGGDNGDDPPVGFLPQTSEDNVLENFELAYRKRDIDAYMRLFAADYQYYTDPVTRQQLGIEFWNRTEDSLATAALFSSPEIKKIVLDLEWMRGPAVTAGFLPPREAWTKIFLTDVYLDVDFAPGGQEVTTFRIENQTQRFFFRRGRTYPPSGPADTLIYIVEWRDQGTASSGKTPSTKTESGTWSGIKSIFFERAPDDLYLPQTSEDNVIENFQRAYRMRDGVAYARLLAPDFQFYFDPATRDQLGIEFWTRTEDSLRTAALFHAREVTRIVIDLEWPNGSAVSAGLLPPRQEWTRLFVTDVFLDVDFAPVGQEVTTFRVENQTQRFFFRQGRTNPPSGPGDTLVYLVEWRDRGTSSLASAALARDATTWGRIKALAN